MPRLFTGLEIPPDIATGLSLLRGGLSGARWIDVENYHLTLRFIGDIDERTAGDVYSALERVRRPALSVKLDGLSTFGGDKPRAIVARAKAEAPLIELQAEHERLMRRIGIPPEPRKFVPHITLARLRAASAMAVADYLGTVGYFPGRMFEAKRFVLFSSRASTGGGPYVIEAAYPLG
ncbi:MAG: 2,3-cyclic 3-phosphodiesterase [Methylobacteriaceae bacterium]|jgi:2'-5' RNA ligase|nr:2,3-cyclic 3-phosphodiesterase [Methylobacteriaceae bacterium]